MRLPAHLLAALLTVFIVRHAEKAKVPGSDDPPLTAAGRARAKELARVLADVPLKAVYATQFQRTQQTAAPAAQAARLPVQKRKAEETAALAAELERDHANDDVLVVAHSDTIGDLLTALGAPVKLGELPATEFDDLFIVDAASGTAKVHRLRYGAVKR